MINIGSLRENIEKSMGRLRSRIAEADGAGIGSGEFDYSHAKAQLQKGEDFLSENWGEMGAARTNTISKWYQDILEDSSLKL